MNDARLRAAAIKGSAQFINEWMGQGGVHNADIIRAQEEFFSDSNYDKKNLRKARNEAKGGSTTQGDNVPTSFGDFIRKSAQSQYADNSGMQGGEFQNLESAANLFINNKNEIKTIRGFFGDMAKILGEQIILYLGQQNDLLEKMNQKTGMLGELSAGFRNEITQASPAAIRLGISFTELSDTITNVVVQSGKFKLLDEKTIADMALVSKFSSSLEEYGNLVPVFERIGLGVGDMNREITKAGKSSMGLGLNARTTVSMIGEQMDKLNQYGFKKGVQGLTEMAQKSIEFRMNMNQAFQLADKVWDPEGALEVVSNLQVIGGAFGDLNDPIKLMYMATNNVEGLQDALQGAAKTLVTFNNEQGRFEVTGANLRRAREMAKAMGVDFKELTNGAVAAMERTQAAQDLMSQGLNINPEQTEFLTNLARMEGGKMVISIPENLRAQLGLEGEQKNVALDTINQSMADKLIAEQDKLKDKSMEEIAQQQVSFVENINRNMSYLVAMTRVTAGKMGQDALKRIGFDPETWEREMFGMTDKIGAKVSTLGVDITRDYINKLPNLGGQKGILNTDATTSPVNNKTESFESIASNDKSQSTQTINMNMTVRSSDNVTDAMKREMYSDPWFTSQAKNSYLESLKQSQKN